MVHENFCENSMPLVCVGLPTQQIVSATAKLPAWPWVSDLPRGQTRFGTGVNLQHFSFRQ